MYKKHVWIIYMKEDTKSFADIMKHHIRKWKTNTKIMKNRVYKKNQRITNLLINEVLNHTCIILKVNIAYFIGMNNINQKSSHYKQQILNEYPAITYIKDVSRNLHTKQQNVICVNI